MAKPNQNQPISADDYLPELTAEVREAIKVPPRSRYNTAVRHSLLPYLALGFTPVYTNGSENLCGINALWRSFRNAREALKPPGCPAIDHVAEDRFRQLLNGEEYSVLVEQALQSAGIYHIRPREDRDEYIRAFKRRTNLELDQLQLLLQVVNKEAGTDFQLGVITQGYRCKWDDINRKWDTKHHVKTQFNVYGQADGRPIIWIYNDNRAAIRKAYGEPAMFDGEAESHWEGFGRYEKSNTRYRATVKGWNLARVMNDDIKAGIWRVIAKQDGSDNQLACSVGAFLHETAPPPSINIREGWRYMATADNQHFGLVPDENLLRINPHVSIPKPLENGEEPEDLDALQPEASQHPPEITVTDFAWDLVQSRTFVIFRAVRPTNRTGGALTDEETLRFERDGFRFDEGDFLFDLAVRENNWVRVRNISGEEGWAHARCLQKVECPWGLPALTEFPLHTDTPNTEWTSDEVIAQARFRGLLFTGTREEVLERIQSWEGVRRFRLPMHRVKRKQDHVASNSSRHTRKTSQSEDATSKKTGLEFMNGEIVLDILDSEIDGKLEVMTFDREIGMVPKSELVAVPGVPWDLKMREENISFLVYKAKTAAIRSQQREDPEEKVESQQSSPKRGLDAEEDAAEKSSQKKKKRKPSKKKN